MDQPIIECDIFDYVTVNGRISKKLCEKVFVSRIRELESKLKAQQVELETARELIVELGTIFEGVKDYDSVKEFLKKGGE